MFLVLGSDLGLELFYFFLESEGFFNVVVVEDLLLESQSVELSR